MSNCLQTKSVAILAFSLLAFSLFNLTQIVVDRGNLAKLQAQVTTNAAEADKVLAENQKMLDKLNNIAIGTQRLAEAGNANAKDIVAQLTRLGIRINPNFKEEAEEAARKSAATPSAAPVTGAPPPGMMPPSAPAPAAPPAP
jgi:septal ring factor EnvC (AmiA/AmiB activator)